MKVIFSHVEFNNHFFCDVEMAKLSNRCAQKQGYKTCLYTDLKGYNKLTPYINYDEVILFDEEVTSQLNPNIWSLGKILAMSMVNEPFMHLDFDLFILKPLPNDFINKDFFSLHPEPWLFIFPYYEKHILQLYKLYDHPEELNFKDFDSYNFAIVGSQKFKEVNYVCSRLIDFSISHGKTLQRFLNKNDYETNINKRLFSNERNINKPLFSNERNINKPLFSNSWSLAVIFEQILIKNLLYTIFNIEISTLSEPEFFTNITNLRLEKNPDIIEISRQYLKSLFIKNSILHLHEVKSDNKLNPILEKISKKYSM